MTIGVLELRLAIREALTLKDKRQVIKSVKDRIREQFNVSVAEVGRQDARQHSEMAVAVVATDGRFAEQVLSQVVNLIRATPWVQLVDYTIEKF